MIQRVVLHGDVSHTRASWGVDADKQWQGLGEAISFVTHQGLYILIDAGYKNSALDKKLCRDVDVLLLTHNDLDHVGGAPALLLRSELLVREVWLPCDWYLLYSAGVNLVDALRRGDTDFEEVARDAEAAVIRAVEIVREHLVNQKRIDEPDGASSPHPRILLQLDEAADSLDNATGARLVDQAVDAIRTRWIGNARQTAQGVISGTASLNGVPRAKASMRVVDAVLRWDGPTRWFSVDHASASATEAPLPWEESGLAGELTVVNARQVEVDPLPPPPTAVDAYALFVVAYALTIQNRRALVALGHTPLKCSHILFTSDSAFEFDQVAAPVDIVPWSTIGAAVGLHHGSAKEPHDHVYEQFGGTVLARSGSNSVTHSHCRFTDLPPERRGCTWCHADGSQRGGFDRHRDVVLEPGSGDDDWRVVCGACTDCPRFRHLGPA